MRHKQYSKDSTCATYQHITLSQPKPRCPWWQHAFICGTSKCCCRDKINTIHMRNVKFTPLISWSIFHSLLSWCCLCIRTVSVLVCSLVHCYSHFISTWSSKISVNVPCFRFLQLSTAILQINFHLSINMSVTSSWGILHFEPRIFIFLKMWLGYFWDPGTVCE